MADTYIGTLGRRVYRRLLSAGLDRTRGHKFSVWFVTCLKSRGLVKGHEYIKEVLTAFKSSRFKLPYEPPFYMRRRSDGCPHALRYLYDISDKLVTILCASHKAVVYPTKTNKQIAKFVDAVRPRSNYDQTAYDACLNYINSGMSSYWDLLSQIDYRHRPGRALSEIYKLYGNDSENWLEQASKDLFDSFGGLPTYIRNLPDIYQTLPESIRRQVYMANVKPARVVGRLGCTQEPGGKLRVYANPNACLQASLTPTKKALFGLLKTLPRDCTFNQGQFVSEISSRLKDKHTLYCADLSNATELWHYGWQQPILQRTHCPSNQQMIMGFVCRGDWDASCLGSNYDLLSWSQGQPQGVGPSFALFALSHNFLLKGMCNELGIADENFVVLGDDLVIFDHSLYMLYSTVLNQAGVTVNITKTVTSNLLAEFAGFTITSEITCRPGKFRSDLSSNVLQVIEDYPYIGKELDNLSLLGLEIFQASNNGNTLSFNILESYFLDKVKGAPKGGITEQELHRKFSTYVDLKSGYTYSSVDDIPLATHILKETLRKYTDYTGNEINLSVFGIRSTVNLLCHAIVFDKSFYDLVKQEDHSTPNKCARWLYTSLYIKPPSRVTSKKFLRTLGSFATNWTDRKSVV